MKYEIIRWSGPKEIEGSREYHIGDILTVTTGLMVSPRGEDGLLDILEYLTGDEIVNIQASRAARECRPFLHSQLPFLKTIDARGVNPLNWKIWLFQQILTHGEFCPVTPIPPEFHQKVDYLDELKDMVEDPSAITLVDPDSPPAFMDFVLSYLASKYLDR